MFAQPLTLRFRNPKSVLDNRFCGKLGLGTDLPFHPTLGITLFLRVTESTSLALRARAILVLNRVISYTYNCIATPQKVDMCRSRLYADRCVQGTSVTISVVYIDILLKSLDLGEYSSYCCFG